MKYLTIGYGDQAGYDRTPQGLRDAAHDHDGRQAAAGAITGVLLEPVQVRNHQGRGLTTQAGSFSTSSLPVAGFSLIEADSLEDASPLQHKPLAPSLTASSRSGRSSSRAAAATSWTPKA